MKLFGRRQRGIPMNKALRYLFWGYLFIFFRINIGFDWLPDPVGYYLIYAGCFMLIDTYPHAKKAGILSAIGIVISIPAVFINLSAPDIDGWEIYSNALFVLKLVVAYFVFSVLKSIAKEYGNQALINRTNSVYNYYISIHLLLLALISFSMNVSGSFWDTLTVMLTLGALIADIAFLLLLGATRRAEPTLDFYA